MRTVNLWGISVFILVFTLGCAGTAQQFQPFKTNSDDEQKAILEKIKGNMVDYDIYECRALTVFDKKSDDKILEINKEVCKPFVQQTPKDFVKIYSVTGIQTLVAPDGQVLGYITWDFQRTAVRAEMVDANTMRISGYRKPGGAPGR